MLYHLAGEGFNLLAEATLTPSDEDSNFPASEAVNGRPAEMYRWGSNSADRFLKAYVGLVVNGGFELSTLLGWTEEKTGSGSSAESSDAHTGTKALECDGGADGTAFRWRERAVRAGQWLQFRAWMKPGAGRTGIGRLLNTYTGKWLQPNGTWGATIADAISIPNATAYTEVALAFQVEDFAHCLWPRPVLRVYVGTSSNGAVVIDDVDLVPAVRFISCHGINWRPVITPQLRSSTDNFGSSDTLEATLTLARPAFYGLLPARVYRPYWQLKLAGTNTSTPRVGEIVLGDPGELLQPQEWGWVGSEDYRHISNESDTGEVFRLRTSDDPLQTLRLRFSQCAAAEFAEIRDELFRRTYGGETPLVVVPYGPEGTLPGEPDVVFGRIMTPFEATRSGLVQWNDELLIRGSGFPVEGL